MNPLVEEMLTAKSRQDLEIAMLEELLLGEVRCESAHLGECPKCLGSAVGRKRAKCDGLNFLICANSYAWNTTKLYDPFHVCSGCGLPCAECWTITPI